MRCLRSAIYQSNKWVSLLVLVIILITPSATFAGEIDLSNYMGAKFEPLKGSYLGAYIEQDLSLMADKEKFNEITDKEHASFFIYLGYGQPFPKWWVEELKSVGAIPQIAWEPNDGLDAVQDDEYLRSFAKDAAASNVPIFLRYGSEMNGNWSAYHGDPDKYIEKWRLVHQVMKEEAPNVAMVWTVFTFPQANIKDYYPGDDYVDWVGVNIYNVVYHNNDINDYAADEDPLELLDYVYQSFSDRKPIQISEWGVTHYTVTDGNYYIDWAQDKMLRMYNGLMDRYPRVKSVYYFNVNNLANAPVDRRINNYSLTANEVILDTYKQVISDDYYLSEFLDNTVDIMVEGKSVELSSYLIVDGDKVYVPLGPVLESQGIKPSFDLGKIEFKCKDYPGAVSLTIGTKETTINGEKIVLSSNPFIHQDRIYMNLSDLQIILPYTVELSREVVYQKQPFQGFIVSDQEPLEIFYPKCISLNGVTMISIRDVADLFAWRIKWNKDDNKLIIDSQIGERHLTIGDSTVQTPNGIKELSNAPINHSGVTYVGIDDINNLFEISIEIVL